MKTISCDLKLGGSTKQLIEWNFRNKISAEKFGEQITISCLTVPHRLALRCACIIGIAATELPESHLDYCVEAVSHATRIAKEYRYKEHRVQS